MKTKFPRSALLALLAIGLGVLASAAHAQQRLVTTHEHRLDKCFFDGAERKRNFGQVKYGPVTIDTEKLVNPPNGYGPRPYMITGLIMPGLRVGNRTPTPEPSSGYTTRGKRDVDPGHVMALHLGGPHHPLNIVPQWATWQRLGSWREMERELDAAARKIADQSRPRGGGLPSRALWMRVSLEYRDTGTVTPSLRAWSFPKRFLVEACSIKINNPTRCDGTVSFDRKVFEGAPIPL
jgi:hypothetical protein